MLNLRYFSNLFKAQAAPLLQCTIASKHIDYSHVPKLNESDLVEQFVRGGGPGGSAVNKNANCVVLTHNPTGKLKLTKKNTDHLDKSNNTTTDNQTSPT